MIDDDANTDTDAVEYRTPSHEYLRSRLQRMDPYAFEAFVADVWEHLGWDTRTVGEPGDRGIDVIATDGDAKQLIQAKRYGPSTTVGSPEVQQYASLRLQEDGVEQVTIVTTGSFSRQAEDLAPDLDVILVDGEALLGILDELEAFEVFAAHFDDIHLGSPDAGPDVDDGSDDGLLDRVRGWLS
jgi:restriction system protein